jgi:hypothetical protein
MSRLCDSNHPAAGQQNKTVLLAPIPPSYASESCRTFFVNISGLPS